MSHAISSPNSTTDSLPIVGSPARINRVVLLLAVAALVAVFLLDIARIQPNRIVHGEGRSVIDALGIGGALLVSLPFWLIAGLALRPTRASRYVMLLLALALLAALPWGLGWFSHHFIDPDQRAARVALASGTWLLIFVLVLMLVDLRQRLRLGSGRSLFLWLVALGSPALAYASGALDWLALVREYQGRSDEFLRAILYHAWLVGMAVGFSLLIGFALALLIRRAQGAQRGTFGVLSFIQTIPSLALFGLLLAPLAWLSAQWPLLADMGVRGIGWAPALLALIGYSLLPMTRNTFVALEGVSPAVIESARGMGMSPLQVFVQVRLPLALPLLIEGVRITTVQAIGLAAVAALIGAGGLGTFIFQGLGQAAMNLVMLGALPIILMALLVDALLKAFADYFRHGEAID